MFKQAREEALSFFIGMRVPWRHHLQPSGSDRCIGFLNLART